MKQAVLVAVALLGSFAAAGRAQSPAARAAEPPIIDGRLELAWQAGLLFDRFAQLEPDVVHESPVKTEVYFLYDAHSVYLGARLHQPRDTVRSAQGRRDAAVVQEGDSIAFILDPLASGNSAYFFIINPANAIADGRLDVAGNWDTSWDGVFSSATQVDDEGWSVEMRLPLSSVSFQAAEDQSWGVLCQRVFAQERRKLLSQLLDENRPYQIGDFRRVTGLRGLSAQRALSVTPYLYGSFAMPREGESTTDAKGGVDLRLRPTASMTLLVAANPDYAQVESDREIINVSDIPTSYPEKRPFFTESSDLYPGLAVYTRRIQDVRLGLKLRHVLPRVKYDATLVEDEEENRWLLGDVRWTDDKTFHVELIGGVKDSGERRDYNVTTNIRGWWFEKRLTAYTWLGTINNPEGAKNEWESVNAIRWRTRRVNIGLWNHFKSEMYNPNVVGHNTLSNEIIVSGWAEYSRYSESGWLRRLTPRIGVDHSDLYNGHDGAYAQASASLTAVLHLGGTLGDGELRVSYSPPIEQKFRHRDTAGYDPHLVFRDAFSSFVLVTQRRPAFDLSVTSDSSRPLGFAATYSKGVVRASTSRSLSLEAYWKVGSRALVSYVFDDLSLGGSLYQQPFRESVHRLKLEYNPTDRLNVRTIFDLGKVAHPAAVEPGTRTPTLNVTASWEYRPGSFLYLVYNDWRSDALRSTPGVVLPGEGERTVALKLSRNFTL